MLIMQPLVRCFIIQDLKTALTIPKLKVIDTPIHSHADVMASYLGLLSQGKSDFDHIEPLLIRMDTGTIAPTT
ncbi:hypothetical protein ACFCP7_14615 [Paenibacillus elgii]